MKKPHYFGYVGGSEHPADRVVIEALQEAGLQRVYGKSWDILWYLSGDPPLHVIDQIEPHQKLNHFPKSAIMCNKLKMYRTLKPAFDRIKTVPKSNELRFFAHTWSMPEERKALEDYSIRHPEMRFIIKPKIGAWGIDIRVIDQLEDIPPGNSWLVQEYLDKPYLYRGYKFNLRLFALLASIEPFVLYVYRDGYVDLAGEVWQPGASGSHNLMHNTNSGIQKQCKRNDSLSQSISFANWLQSIETDGVDTEPLWQRIIEVIAKSLICVQPHLITSIGELPIQSSNCFELFGFDVMLDEQLNPWVIEHNRSPSMTMEFIPSIKRELVRDLLRVVNIDSSTRPLANDSRTIEDQPTHSYPGKVGGFERVYPSNFSANLDHWFTI
ncbi:MAG: hypothetical protein ACI8P9_004169 [Parasphingorhabdus sp.]|jgi:hypothetical protein